MLPFVYQIDRLTQMLQLQQYLKKESGVLHLTYPVEPFVYQFGSGDHGIRLVGFDVTREIETEMYFIRGPGAQEWMEMIATYLNKRFLLTDQSN